MKLKSLHSFVESLMADSDQQAFTNVICLIFEAKVKILQDVSLKYNHPKALVCDF